MDITLTQNHDQTEASNSSNKTSVNNKSDSNSDTLLIHMEDTPPIHMEDSDVLLHSPKHPLPEEIQRMERDETVCKYCGISYLIHHEFKKLEEKLKNTLAELLKYQGLDEQNLVLKDKISDLEGLLKNKESVISDNNILLTVTKNSLQSMKSETTSLSEKCQSLQKDLSSKSTDCSYLTSVLNTQLENLKSINDKVKVSQSSISALRNECLELKRSQVVETESFAQHVVNWVAEKLKRKEAEINQLNLKIDEMSDHDRNNTNLLHEKSKEADQRIETLLFDNSSLKEEIKQMQIQLKTINSENKALITNLEKAKQQNDQEIECQSKLQKELESQHLSFRTREHLLEQTVERLNNEIVSFKSDSAKMQTRFDEIKGALKIKDNTEQEYIIKSASSQSKIEELNKTLERTMSDVDALKTERDMIITAHQNQIAELRTSFKRLNDNLQKQNTKLETTIRAEKDKHRREIENVESIARSNFNIELQIEKQKNKELLEKFKSQHDEEKTNMINDFESRLSIEANSLRKKLHDCQQSSADTIKGLKNELASLKTLISSLEDKLAKASVLPDDTLELRSQIHRLSEEARDLKDERDTAVNHNKTIKEEVTLLQETVKRECEERFELTEALSQAREQLLSYIKPVGGYSFHSNQNSSITPAPPLDPPSVKPTATTTHRTSPAFYRTNPTAQAASTSAHSNLPSSTSPLDTVSSAPPSGLQHDSKMITTRRRVSEPTTDRQPLTETTEIKPFREKERAKIGISNSSSSYKTTASTAQVRRMINASLARRA